MISHDFPNTAVGPVAFKDDIPLLNSAIIEKDLDAFVIFLYTGHSFRRLYSGFIRERIVKDW